MFGKEFLFIIKSIKKTKFLTWKYKLKSGMFGKEFLFIIKSIKKTIFSTWKYQ